MLISMNDVRIRILKHNSIKLKYLSLEVVHLSICALNTCQLGCCESQFNQLCIGLVTIATNVTGHSTSLG